MNSNFLWRFSQAKPKEVLKEDKGWLTDNGYNSLWHKKHAEHNPKFENMRLVRHPQWSTERLKEPSTWVKVTTTLEKDSNPTHMYPDRYG